MFYLAAQRRSGIAGCAPLLAHRRRA